MGELVLLFGLEQAATRSSFRPHVQEEPIFNLIKPHTIRIIRKVGKALGVSEAVGIRLVLRLCLSVLGVQIFLP
jgi:hypothetical protein